MTLADIDESFDHTFPHEAMPEVLRVASELGADGRAFHGGAGPLARSRPPGRLRRGRDEGVPRSR